MKVTQITPGRFHHFQLARQMERLGLLAAIWSGYPHFKLKDETGISSEKIHTFPPLHTPFMVWDRIPVVNKLHGLQRELAWWDMQTLDAYVAAQLREPTILLALSSVGLKSGRKAQDLGGFHICDRGSSHIRFQEDIVNEERTLWGIEREPFDPRVVAKEEAEYEQAELITVPSEFVERSFVERGVPLEKLRLVPYGARLERFSVTGEPASDEFTALFVGQFSLRKGAPYLLEGFARLSHPRKKLIIVGSIEGAIKPLLDAWPLEGVEFRGQVPNADLPNLYSRADVLVLPSIEEGFGMVMGEALACGCPVVATSNTGAKDLFSDGREGFRIPIRDSGAIGEALQKVADSRGSMREAAVKRARSIGGWDQYGDRMQEVVAELSSTHTGVLS